MKRKTIPFSSLAALLFLLCAAVPEAVAFWEWTPGSGRWTHSRWSARDTAAEQYEWAREALEEGNADTALRRLGQLTRRFPESGLVPAALLLAGQIHEREGNSVRALGAYEELLEKHPGSEESEAAAARIFALGPSLRVPRRRLGLFSPPDKAVDAVLTAVEKAPFSPGADQALFEVGLRSRKGGKLAESVEIFDRLAGEYPDSPERPRAEYLAARSLYELGSRQRGNRRALEDASSRVEAWLARYPGGEDRDAVLALGRAILEEVARREMEIADFYERTGNPGAARVYYRRVIELFPGTAAAGEARSRLP